MKRLDLVQLTIIIVGIMSAFEALGLMPEFFYYLVNKFTDGLSSVYSTRILIMIILELSVYSIFAIYGIKNSKKWAEYVCDKASMDGAVNFSLDKKEILYVLFIGLGVTGLIKSVPELLKNGILYLQTSEASQTLLFEEPARVTKSGIWKDILTSGLYLILLIYAKTFAEFFAAKISNVEPEDEINNETAA